VRLRDRLSGGLAGGGGPTGGPRADLCLTGEGRLDASSRHGKAPVGVARACRAAGVPCLAVVGSAGEGADVAAAEGLTGYWPIGGGALPAEESIRDAPRLIAETTAAVVHRFVAGWRA
jgi:glycerate kinase